MTNDLYSDIQSTIQSVFITVAKFQSKNSDQSLYLYQLGTDQLECFFSTIRTLTHSKNCNFLELKQRMVIALQIEKVYIDNPMWRKSSRVSATTNDHSSAASWTGNLQTNTEEWSLKTIWHYSNSRAKNLLTDYGYSQTELTISDNSIKMLQPFGSILEIIDTQPSILSFFSPETLSDETELEFNEEMTQDNTLDVNINEFFETNIDTNGSYKHYVEIDGFNVHKNAAVKKFINCITKSSTDRLHRVFNSTPVLAASSNYDVESNDLIRLSDTLLTLVKLKGGAISAVLFCVNKIKHKNEVLLSIKNSLIKEAVFHGSILKFSSISETTLNWQAEYGDNACFDGQYCVECIEEPIFNFDAVFSLNNLKNSIEYLSNLYKTGNIQDQNLKCVQNPFTSEIFSIFELKIDSIKKKSLLTVTCDFCSKEIVHSKMREHIASYIVVF